MAVSGSKLIALALVLLAGIGIAGYVAVRGSGYMDVSDLAGITRETRVTVEGTIVDYKVLKDQGEIMFVLEGRDGSKVLAYFSLDRFIGIHGRAPGDWMLGQEIVVQGVFYPGGVPGALGYIDVSELLKGCHTAYEAPTASS